MAPVSAICGVSEEKRRFRGGHGHLSGQGFDRGVSRNFPEATGRQPMSVVVGRHVTFGPSNRAFHPVVWRISPSRNEPVIFRHFP